MPTTHRRRARVFWSMSVALLAIAAFGLPVGASAASKPFVVALGVSPTANAMPQGVTQQLRASAVYSDGSRKDVTSSVRWSSSANGVASVRRGTVTTHAMGTATITATWKAFVGTATVSVADQLVSIRVDPAVFVMVGVGESIPFSALGQPLTGVEIDVMAWVSWSSIDTSIVTVDATGLATCVNLGPAGVNATLGEATGGTSVSCIQR